MKKVISLLGIMAGVILAVAIGAGSVRAEAHDNHCICGGNGTCIAVAAANGHTANTPTAWQEATDDTTFRDLITNTADGGEVFIYLGASFEMSDSHVSVTGKTIHLCLNGCTITTKSTRRLFYLPMNDTLTICDCSAGETGKITAPNGASGVDGVGGLIRCVGSTVELYSGTLANGYAKNSQNGGIISCVKSTSAGSSTFKMYGGTITGGKAAGRAGNVDISESYFYMYGGTISGGTSTKWGGNVSLAASSTFVMEGGTISGGNAGSYGGSVVINASSASFTMNGGEIKEGTSTTSGGNVYNAGTFTMNGSSKITDGNSGSHGGNIATEKPMTMNGGEISGGTATTYGGNLSVTSNGTATLKGGEISGGTAGSYDGWNIFSEGTLIINGNPVITNTPPSGTYYDVYIKKACTISGEPVFKIDTTSTARGIKLNTTNATLTVNSGYFLCNVYATGGAQATLKGGVYSKNVVSETKESNAANITVDGGYYYGDVKPTDSNPGTMEINGGCFRKSPIEDANITYNANLWTIGGNFRIPFTGYAKYKETDGSAHYLQMQYALTTCEQITGKNMTLNENLALGLYVNVDLDHPLYKNRDNVGKISVTLNGETREAALTALTDYDATTKKFSFEGVTPELMGDTITVELIASDGVSVIDTKTYTIKGYLEELLTGTPSTELTNLVNDLLIYGGEAQKKFNHNTDNLVSAGITGTSGDPSGDVTVIYNKTEVTAANYQDASVIPGYFKEATAIHENINWIRVKYQDNSNDDGTTFTIQKGTGAEEAATLDHGYLCTGGLKPTEYGTTIIFRAYRGTEEISRVEYSMNSYCVRKHSATGHEFSDALYRYGASAAAYAGN